MVNTKDLVKIKEYERFVLYEHKDTGIKECILKIDLVDRDLTNKYKRKE